MTGKKVVVTKVHPMKTDFQTRQISLHWPGTLILILTLWNQF